MEKLGEIADMCEKGNTYEEEGPVTRGDTITLTLRIALALEEGLCTAAVKGRCLIKLPLRGTKK